MEELPERQPSVETLYQATVGPRGQDFYMPYFQRAHQRGYAAISWNWPVFFVGFFWFLYRKLYLWAALVFIFPSGALIASGIVGGAGSLTNPLVFSVSTAVVAGSAGFATAFGIMSGAALLTAVVVGSLVRETLERSR